MLGCYEDWRGDWKDLNDWEDWEGREDQEDWEDWEDWKDQVDWEEGNRALGQYFGCSKVPGDHWRDTKVTNFWSPGPPYKHLRCYENKTRGIDSLKSNTPLGR